MAKKKGNSLSGSIGNTVHYRLGDKEIVRSKPSHVNDPETPAQMNHRKKIRLSSRIIKAMAPMIKIGYQGTLMDQPGNEARSYILKNTFEKSGDTVELNYSKVLIARGELRQPDGYTLEVNENVAIIKWLMPSKGYDWFADDKVMIGMYSEEGREGFAKLISNAALRKDLNAVVQVPPHKMPLHVWMFYYAPGFVVGESQRNVSNSVYLGKIE